MTKPTKATARRHHLILAGVLGLAAVALLIFINVPSRTGGGYAPGLIRGADLRALGTLIVAYADENDGALPDPERWAAVLADYAELHNDPHFNPDRISTMYFLLPAAASSNTFTAVDNPSESLMMYEHPGLSDVSTNILYWDGSSKQVPDRVLERLLTESDARLGERYRPHEGVTP